MKVLLITEDSVYLDPDAVTREYLTAHGEVCSETHVVVLSKRGEGMLRVEVVPRVWVYATNSITRFLAPLDAVRIARRLGAFDVISAQEPFSAGLAALWSKKLARNVLQVVVRARDFGPATTRSLRSRLAQAVIRNASCMRVFSEEEKHYLRSIGLTRGKNVSILPQTFESEQRKEYTGIHEPHVGPHRAWPFIVGAVVTDDVEGSAVPYLLTVFAALAHVYPWVGFVVRMPRYYEKVLAGLVAERSLTERIAYDPVDADEHKELPAVDVLLCTARPTTATPYLAQAARQGIPIVGTATGILGSVLADGEACLLCAENDTECFVRHIRHLVEDNGERARLAMHAKQAAPPSQTLSRAAWLAQLKHCYETCELHIVE